MKIDYADIVLLNALLKRRDTRYHVSYKDENTVCIEPPGECCLTDDRKMNARKCIEDYYGQKNIEVHQRILRFVNIYFIGKGGHCLDGGV